MFRRDFLMLAKDYDSNKHEIVGWFASEKLDGMRAYWDGGFTRGIKTVNIPWSDTNKGKSTGLWSRYAKPIYAPDWWLDKLPRFPTDGELWIGYQKFQELSSIVRRQDFSGDWSKVEYHIFDLPPFESLLKPGKINNPNLQMNIDQFHFEWMQNRLSELNISLMGPQKFKHTYNLINAAIKSNDVVQIVDQKPINSLDDIDRYLGNVVWKGGEGLMFRNPNSHWIPQRTPNLLKHKPIKEDYVTVIGYQWGRETDKGSKYLGQIGSLLVEYNGKKFSVSGLNDDERRLLKKEGTQEIQKYYFRSNAGLEVDTRMWYSNRFPLGSKVKIRFRDFTNDGIPKEPRYVRD